MYGLGGDMSGALGYAPAGMYSGLDPSASQGAYGGNPLGGGIAGQMAGNTPISGPSQDSANQMMQMMLIQSAMQNASKIGQTAPISMAGQEQYAQPQSQVTPQMMGMMMGAR